MRSFKVTIISMLLLIAGLLCGGISQLRGSKRFARRLFSRKGATSAAARDIRNSWNRMQRLL